jgi:hypothetical protein
MLISSHNVKKGTYSRKAQSRQSSDRTICLNGSQYTTHVRLVRYTEKYFVTWILKTGTFTLLSPALRILLDEATAQIVKFSEWTPNSSGLNMLRHKVWTEVEQPVQKNHRELCQFLGVLQQITEKAWPLVSFKWGFLNPSKLYWMDFGIIPRSF